MALPKFSIKELFLSVFWISAGMACAAFSFRPSGDESLRPSDDTSAMIGAVARLAALVVCGACIGTGIGTLVRRQFRFAILGALLVALAIGSVVAGVFGPN